jgi:hypothetical protein
MMGGRLMRRSTRFAVPALAVVVVLAASGIAVAAPGQSDNLARSGVASASYTSPWESVAAVNDGIDPLQSNDTTNRRWGTWPNQGEQWAEIQWSSAQTLRSADVYFFDDNGGVRVPASWKLQSYNGSAYVDVSGASGYPVAVNRYNVVNFSSVSTTRLRVVLQSGAGSVGLLELRAYASAIPTSPPTTTPPTTTPPTSGWTPPSNLVTPLNEVWNHVETTYPNLYGFRNYGWDQVMANGGSMNYCVRWDSSTPVTAAQRDQVQATLSRQFKKWMDVMAGHNGWPYANVPVKVVGWAVRDRNTLQWTDNSVDIYVNNIRENAPQCSEPCGRFFHIDGNYSGCPGGGSHHYDMSLWLTSGFSGGAGGDWGQRISSEYYMSNLNTDNVHILLHEIGHGFGLDDFYDWTPTGQCCFIMNAGSATMITEFDKWMLRDWWRHLKNRYGF